LLYGKFEEDHGLARRAMAVYDRACDAVGPEDRKDMYFVYINRAAEFFGVSKTREIYEKAIQNLPDKHLKPMCTRYAELERKLGEIDRARAIYVYGSQFCDPRTDADYWKTWHDFEVTHGNEDTFREMLRIRRSVQAQYSQLNAIVNLPPSALNAPTKIHVTPMQALEVAAQKEGKEREQKKEKKESVFTKADLQRLARSLNPEEIDIDAIGEEHDEADIPEDIIGTKTIPATVYGMDTDNKHSKKSTDTRPPTVSVPAVASPTVAPSTATTSVQATSTGTTSTPAGALARMKGKRKTQS